MESLDLADAREGVLHKALPWLVDLLDWTAAGIDLCAILLLLVGAVRFVGGVAASELRHQGSARLRGLNHERVELGRYILAGLELLIVSDIIHTSLSLALADLLFLGLLVIIRSLTSFVLDRELGELRRELGEGRDVSALPASVDPPEGRG